VDNIGQSKRTQNLSLAGLPRRAISAQFGSISLPRPVKNPDFRMTN
jgi:hypothetical protein